MKILLINKYHYLRGGAERVYLETKKLLEKHGHEVICFSMQDERNEDSAWSKYFVDPVDFSHKRGWFRKGWRFLYYPAAAKKLEQLIRQEKPDMAHWHNITHQLTYAILKPLRQHKIPIVQTLHDYQLISPNYNLHAHGRIDECVKKNKYYKCVFCRCVQASAWSSFWAMVEMYLIKWLGWDRQIDQYLAPSKFLRDKFKEWGFGPEIKVLNNFVDSKQYEPNFEPGDYVVYAGRLSREKGVFTLVKAMRKIPDIKLKIVGAGPLKKSIKDYLERKQIKNVVLVGPRYGEDLHNLIKQARFLVVPSEWYENYPMVTIEAMALGKPVLAARIGGLQEQVQAGYNGWFFEPGKIKLLRPAILSAYQDETLEVMGRAARKTVETKNDPELFYQQLMAQYERLLREKKKIGLG